MVQPLISICVPAYKRPDNVSKLLESIKTQSFRNYEIVITDDSPGDELKPVIQKYSQLNIAYYKNEPALGTPANWNMGISKARGEWIKVIHDDDWLSSSTSLQEFAEATKAGKKFIFAGYSNIFEDGRSPELKLFPLEKRSKIIDNPLLLLAENVIGPPSVTLIHRSVTEQYDTYMKWRVDIDFYIRLLLKEKDFFAIRKPLVNVGVGESQVTNSCIDKPEVELPEGLLLLKKYGVQRLKNLWVYDAWWRILRNVKVRSVDDLKRYTSYDEWPNAILQMVNHQKKLNYNFLKFGVFSKIFMSLSYLFNYSNLNTYK